MVVLDLALLHSDVLELDCRYADRECQRERYAYFLNFRDLLIRGNPSEV